jgi:TolB protein
MRSRSLPLLLAIGAVTTSVVVAAPAAQAGGVVRPSYVFTSDRDGDPEIFVRRTDGSTVQLTRNRVVDDSAVWSPDGKRLAFLREHRGGLALFVMDAGGTDVRRLTTPVPKDGPQMSRDMTPAWSPEGATIAFASDRASFETEIWRIDADGTGLRRLTRTAEHVTDVAPSWTPDGRWIYFSSTRVSFFNPEVFRMRPDGTGVQRITRTENHVDDGAPDVSPDGRTIVFMSTRGNGDQDMFTMALDGSGVRRLGGGAALVDEFFPRWTADGGSVLYMRFGTPEVPRDTIWSIDADGTDRRRITAGRANDSMPDPYPVLRR